MPGLWHPGRPRCTCAGKLPMLLTGISTKRRGSHRQDAYHRVKAGCGWTLRRQSWPCPSTHFAEFKRRCHTSAVLPNQFLTHIWGKLSGTIPDAGATAAGATAAGTTVPTAAAVTTADLGMPQLHGPLQHSGEPARPSRPLRLLLIPPPSRPPSGPHPPS